MNEYSREKTELLDAALSLFSQTGYDKTSVGAIINQAGVSEETFSRHFTSKEDLVEELVQHMSKQLMDKIDAEVRDTTLSGLDKLNTFFSLAYGWKEANIDVLLDMVRVLYREENHKLVHKMKRANMAMITPLLTDIIAQGKEEGVFDTYQPEEAAELIWHIRDAYADLNAQALLEAREDHEVMALMKRRVELFIDACERILGVPKGSIARPEEAVYEAISSQLFKKAA